MTTIYNECIQLKNHNDVLDLTEDYLYNNPKIDLFKRDINIINNAYVNIGVGHGGQFCLNLSFAKNMLYYVPKGLIDFNIKNSEFNILNNLLLFIEQIKKILN